ncbi:MAG: aspartyl/asparaginyl beta-hydroxylase domain-containing protein [Woeseiaceae bacterium]|nr:aspartyl/asparaginyl beta-hydroxylase domain-containing protein [Woeseiaceae bacterium]
MNFAGNFKYLGSVDTRELRRRVDTLTEEQWSAFEMRQKRYEVHRDTQTIGLVFNPDFRHSHPTRLPALEIFQDALQPVLATVAGHYEATDEGQRLTQQYGLGYFIRATLVRLRAGGTIDPHRDNNFSLVHSHRVHLPVITNDQVLFTVGSETRALAAGEIHEINNRRMHSVRNESAEDRVHFILDFVLPGEMCCCGRRLHPGTLCSPQACLATDRLQVPCTCHPEEQDAGG